MKNDGQGPKSRPLATLLATFCKFRFANFDEGALPLWQEWRDCTSTKYNGLAGSGAVLDPDIICIDDCPTRSCRAPPRSGRGGRRFKSCHSDQNSPDKSASSKSHEDRLRFTGTVMGTETPAALWPEPRRFPPPWSVEEQEACFVVRDHKASSLPMSISRTSRVVPFALVALRSAANIARLPDLLIKT